MKGRGEHMVCVCVCELHLARLWQAVESRCTTCSPRCALPAML